MTRKFLIKIYCWNSEISIKFAPTYTPLSIYIFWQICFNCLNCFTLFNIVSPHSHCIYYSLMSLIIISFFLCFFFCAADQLWTRFKSNRTEHGRLRKKLHQKSGQGAQRLTLRQQFKLDRWSFLDAYQKPKSSQEQLGQVSFYYKVFLLIAAYYTNAPVTIIYCPVIFSLNIFELCDFLIITDAHVCSSFLIAACL